MPEIFTDGDQAFLIDPDSGQVTAIARDKVGAALAAGFVPATKDEAQAGIDHQYYSSAGQQLKTGALSALSGATLGASDLLATKSGLVTPEELKAGREVNPNLAMGANVAGGILGAFVPGGPVALAGKGAAKVGAAAGQAVAKGLAAPATALVPKAAEAIAREALIGGAIGAGQGVAKTAEDDLSLGDALLKIAESGGQGALFGGALGAVGFGAKTFGQKHLKKLTGKTQDLKRLQGQEKMLRAEIEAAKASGMATDHLEDQLAVVTTAVIEQQAGVLKQVFQRAVGMGIGATMGGGLGLTALGYMMAPKVVNTLGKALTPIGARSSGVVGRLWQRISPAAGRAAEAAKQGAGKVAEASGARGAAESLKSPLGDSVAQGIGIAEKQAGKMMGKLSGMMGKDAHLYVETAGHAAGSAAGTVLSAAPDEVLSGAIIGGMEGALFGAAVHKFGKASVVNLINAIGAKVARPVVSSFEKSTLATGLFDFHKLTDDLDPAVLDAVIQAQMPQDMPPQMAQEVSKRVNAALEVLRENRPPSAGDKPNMAELKKFNAVARVITDPESFFDEFASGRLSGAQVAAWEKVYPEALAQLRGIVRAEMAHAEASGAKYSRQQKASIETLLGERKLYDAGRVAQMQAIHQKSQGEKAAQRSQIVRMATSRQTPMQRISSGG